MLRCGTRLDMLPRILFLGICLAVPSLFAQANGRLTGTVVDPTGAAVPGAKVELFLAGGATALTGTQTNAAGLFAFAALRPETYDLAVMAPGFAKTVNRQVKVESIRETSMGTIQLEVASTSEVVEVSATTQGVQLANSELATTVTRQMIENLPTSSRQVSTLFQTQAGVSDGRGPTTVNGMRTSATSVTLDGVNIQDNFIRTNALDFMPIRPTIDQIAEMTIAVGNAGATLGGGAGQITMTTRSGSNDYHGSLYYFNQNTAYNANEFFNNRSNVAKPQGNQNQFGGSVGGRVIRDKLFFFGNYEALRYRGQASQLRTVLTQEARNGTFRYRTGATTATANVLALKQFGLDPTASSFLQSMPLPNSSDAGDGGLVSSGYRFNAQANTARDQFVSRWDYYLNSAHNMSFSYNRTSEYNDRPDVTTQFFSPIPPNNTDSTRTFISMGWRWTVAPTLTNELRGGFLLSPTAFNRVDPNPKLIVGSTFFTSPQNNFLPQGRNTDTYSIQDNANWLKGRHDVSFGMQANLIRTAPYNDAGAIPTATLGISAANTRGLVAADVPGITSADLSRANSFLATMAGIVSSQTQSFFVNDPGAGFAQGIGERRNWTYDTWAGYVQDKWKARSNLSLTLGVRYELWTVLKETKNLYLLPGQTGGSSISTVMNPNAVLDFVGRDGRKLYNLDKNNFAPSFGFAYDPFGKGRTSVRGGYSISFINDDSLTVLRNNTATNRGLNTTVRQANMTVTLPSVPAIPVPSFSTPLTQLSQYNLDRTIAVGTPDLGLKTPYVQQFSFGIQQEVKSWVVEARWVSTRGTQLLRAVDYNQIDIRDNGFLADFLRAQSNAFLSLRANGSFNPAYTGPGSQALTVFPRLSNPSFTSASIQQYIREGQPAELAYTYHFNNLQGSVPFFRNPNAVAANVVVNGANSTYHALQVDVRRRVKAFNLQANYTWSKTLSDVQGHDDQTRVEPYLDFGNPSLERARTPFDLRHAFKMNGSYDVPFGKGRRWTGNAVTNQILGGWTVAGNLSWVSGFPFSILSQRGTLNRAARSTGRNTANTTLTYDQLTSDVLGLRKIGSGVMFVNAANLTAAGRAVASDGDPAFAGQVFFHPTAGTVGSLQRRMFSGPSSFNLDMSLQKTFHVRDRHSFQVRADAFNLPNHPSFTIGAEQDINSINFGRITGMNIGARYLQFGLYYRF